CCGGSVMLWAMFCWEILGPAIHVDVTLTRTTYLSIVADHVHTFMETVFPDGLFQQDNAPCTKSQSNRASVGCAGQTSLIHGGPTSQLRGLVKGSADNILVPDTTAHLQGSDFPGLVLGQSQSLSSHWLPLLYDETLQSWWA
ncbi:hypothetical protein QTP86_024529, partial [Hemibagrus guttatus]